MLVAGFGLVALPVALQSQHVVGRLGLFPISGGLNLFLGNNADVCETVTIRPGTSAWMDLIGQSGLGDVEDMVERSRSLGNEAKEFAAGEPLAFARGLGSKAVRFVAGRELPRNIDIYVFREWSVLLRVLVWKAGRFGFPWGILLPLAVTGLVFRWRQAPLPVALFFVLYPLSVIVVFVSARYRVPLVPVTSVLAAAGCLHLVSLWRGRRVARAVAALGVAAVTAALVNLPRPFCEEQIDYAGEMYVWLGDDERDAGRLEEARLRYDQALSSDPDSALAHVRMGHLMVRTGDLDGATDHLSAALDQGADYVAYYYRGYAYMKAADFARALRDFDAAIGMKPRFAPAYLARGDTHYGRGDNDRARRDWERVLEIPEYADAIEKARARLQALEQARP
jgi:Tfp pilus assembly protein PilF